MIPLHIIRDKYNMISSYSLPQIDTPTALGKRGLA